MWNTDQLLCMFHMNNDKICKEGKSHHHTFYSGKGIDLIRCKFFEWQDHIRCKCLNLSIWGSCNDIFYKVPMSRRQSIHPDKGMSQQQWTLSWILWKCSWHIPLHLGLSIQSKSNDKVCTDCYQWYLQRIWRNMNINQWLHSSACSAQNHMKHRHSQLYK